MKRTSSSGSGMSGGNSASGRWRRKSFVERTAGGGGSSIHSLGADVFCRILTLLDYFDVARCAVVCKSWHNIIHSSTLLRDLYTQRGPKVFSMTDLPVPSGPTLSTCLEELAMEQHRLLLLNQHAEVHQWAGHSNGVSQCRMKRGLILTGVGDKAIRLWSTSNYQCLGEYSVPGTNSLIDVDFDESKVVGLIGSQICIWRRNGKTSILKSRECTFGRNLCMRYMDPEAVVGCEDGRSRVFDMYAGSCSRIIRMHVGPVTCLSLTDEQLILGGSSFGSISVADVSSGESVAFLKSSISPIGISSLWFNKRTHLVFAGSTSGYCHCWDLRTLRPLWELRISPNVIYALHHMSNDTTLLAAGGIDGVLRILSQQTGKVLSSYVTNRDSVVSSYGGREVTKKFMARAVGEGAQIDSIPKCERPSITSLAVGMNNIVTMHNERYIRLWRFREGLDS